MNDFFNVKKTGNVILWVGSILGLFVSASTLMEGNIAPGLFWLGIAIFCFYTIWQRKKRKASVSDSTASTTKKMDKKWKIIIGGILALFVVFIIVANYQNQGQTVSREWARITSPDAKLSVDLPRNPVFKVDNSSDVLENYSYIAYEKQDKVAYTIKYENYHAVVIKTNVDLKNANEQIAQSFLKGLVDSTVQEFNLSNFTSEFIISHGYNAVKFSGEISQNGKSAEIDGIIILVGEATYSLTSLAENGYTADFDRVLNSLVIK